VKDKYTDTPSPSGEQYFNYPSEQSTGDNIERETKTIECEHERYIIKLRLTTDNKFIGIEEVKTNKSFLSINQEIQNTPVVDTDYLYEED